jgi:hypothetical protein
MNLFAALKGDLTEDSFKLCRWVSKVGEAVRPLVVGFCKERDRAKLQRCDTRGTVFEDVEVCSDLTKAAAGRDWHADEAIKRNMAWSDKIGQKTCFGPW